MNISPDEIAAAVLETPPRLGRVRLLAIDGPSGAGKSMLADFVVERLRVRHVSTTLVRTDDFATWDEPVEWWPRLMLGVLEPLRVGESGSYRRTEWAEGAPRLGETVSVDVPEVLVLEGVSAGRRSVSDALSLLVHLRGGDERERLERSVARDGEESRARLEEWQEFERGWFAVDDPYSRADLRDST
ncbi:uridine kinase [Herbihabitans rhizosphaerae]|uniref:Uridine kinase n=1 Tax=Herbihabitans rhizosphaerae TaxID=1872711 RepID=A0A4Q7L7T9_9PSEU|nr:(d)CMP kinase [Herbihabitans rhizosphaerae]RZS44970.1 uridine kinase [Herbihabitans rhizosphaerae]